MIHMDEVLTKFVTASHSKIYIFVKAVCNSNSNYCSGNQSLQQHNFKLMKYYAIAKITLLHPQCDFQSKVWYIFLCYPK